MRRALPQCPLNSITLHVLTYTSTFRAQTMLSLHDLLEFLRYLGKEKDEVTFEESYSHRQGLLKSVSL